ncbi:MAG: hypothetical protein JRN15_15735 [Nitrososphaerota archaeon]|nr:hypothetical protein [Nitrososphaerota archaeon]
MIALRYICLADLLQSGTFLSANASAGPFFNGSAFVRGETFTKTGKASCRLIASQLHQVPPGFPAPGLTEKRKIHGKIDNST